jgi:hypothetical protein
MDLGVFGSSGFGHLCLKDLMHSGRQVHFAFPADRGSRNSNESKVPQDIYTAGEATDLFLLLPPSHLTALARRYPA